MALMPTPTLLAKDTTPSGPRTVKYRVRERAFVDGRLVEPVLPDGEPHFIMSKPGQHGRALEQVEPPPPAPPPEALAALSDAAPPTEFATASSVAKLAAHVAVLIEANTARADRDAALFQKLEAAPAATTSLRQEIDRLAGDVVALLEQWQTTNAKLDEHAQKLADLEHRTRPQRKN